MPIAATRRNSVPTPHRAALIPRRLAPTLRRAARRQRRVAAAAAVAPRTVVVADRIVAVVVHMAAVAADVTNPSKIIEPLDKPARRYWCSGLVNFRGDNGNDAGFILARLFARPGVLRIVLPPRISK